LRSRSSARHPRQVTDGPVTRPLPVEDPAIRLFMFHCGGGSHLLYRGWASHFPANWEVCLLDFPGRGQLRAMPLVDDCDELVTFFRKALLPWLDRPFAFFGHSMGSLIAYELTRCLVREGDPLPGRLDLSGWGAPGTRSESDGVRHLMDDDELRDWLRSVGGCPPELLGNDALWRQFAPVFRSDFKVVGTWTPPDEGEVLPVPISAHGGLDDALADSDRLLAWREHTSDFLGLHMYDGGHFYLTEHQRSIVERVTGKPAGTGSGRTAEH
jgi:surfactin synthase thioesterase subunit